MIGRSYGDRMQCWPSGINCQNFVLDKGIISVCRDADLFFHRFSMRRIYSSEVLYVITMSENQLMIEQYRRIRRAQENEVEVEMPEYVLTVEGSGLTFQMMTKDEILLQGRLDCLRVSAYEERSGA